MAIQCFELVEIYILRANMQFFDSLQKHMDGHFHRKKQLKPFLKFDGWVQERIDDGIAYLSQLLVKRGHQALPINFYKYYRRAEAKLSS